MTLEWHDVKEGHLSMFPMRVSSLVRCSAYIYSMLTLPGKGESGRLWRSIKETSSFPAVGSRIRSMGNKAGQHTARTLLSLGRSGICTSAEAGCLNVSVK